ncbi:MAG: hypothetical protein GY887_11465, partial [Halieaceae bacterium]|nr:hypothetical protein [Halieaceae bacterium]
MNEAGIRDMSSVGCATLLLVIALSGCSDSSDNSPPSGKTLPQADNPVVEGPVTGGGGDDCCIIDFGIEVDLRQKGLDYKPGTPFYTFLNFDLADVGYEETEYFFSGTATSYVSTEELRSDGFWSVQKADLENYRSRMVVLRPIDAEDFNGTVV